MNLETDMIDFWRVLLPCLIVLGCSSGGPPTQKIRNVEVDVRPPIVSSLRGGALITGADTDQFGRQQNGRTGLAVAERLKLRLLGPDGTDLTDSATFESSEPAVAMVEETSVLRGIATGEVIVCGRSGVHQGCGPFVVGGFLATFSYSSSTGAGTDQFYAAADGAPVRGDAAVWSTGGKQWVTVSVDGRWLLNQHDNRVMDTRKGAWRAFVPPPEAPAQPDNLWITSRGDGFIAASLSFGGPLFAGVDDGTSGPAWWEPKLPFPGSSVTSVTLGPEGAWILVGSNQVETPHWAAIDMASHAVTEVSDADAGCFKDSCKQSAYPEPPPSMNGGTETPWGTVHFYLVNRDEGTADAWEVAPGSPELLPSRYYIPFDAPDPAGRFVFLNSLYAPVGFGPEPTVEWSAPDGFLQAASWVFTGPRPPSASTFEAAPDPGAFLAIPRLLSLGTRNGDTPVVHRGIEAFPLGGGPSTYILAGNQDVAGFDVSRTGAVFAVTEPAGYLLMTDRWQRHLTVIAIGVLPPVSAAADGSAVAVRTPAKRTVAYDVETGTELWRVPAAQTVCLQGSGKSAAAAVQGKVYRREPGGDWTFWANDLCVDLTDPLVPRPKDAEYQWSDDCATLIAACDGKAYILSPAHEGYQLLAAGGQVEHVGIARDGSAVALTVRRSVPTHAITGLDDAMGIEVLLVGFAPEFAPTRKVLTYEHYANGIEGPGVDQYFIGPPVVWPGGGTVAFPFETFNVITQVNPDNGSSYMRIRTELQLYRVDTDSRRVTDLGAIAGDDVQKLGTPYRMRLR